MAYYRTSSAGNVGCDKDSLKRQRAAVEAYAKASRIKIVADFYDGAVSGADLVDQRPGFAAMLERITSTGVSTVLIEEPSRFARDLAVQLAGHDKLKELGIELIAASAPDHFLEDTPTAVLVRQVLGAIAQFDRAQTVAKLKAARDRKRETEGRCEGRRSLGEMYPEAAAMARRLRWKGKGHRCLPLQQVAAALASAGYVADDGQSFTTRQVQKLALRPALKKAPSIRT